MPEVSYGEAAHLLGYKSRATLYRMRDDGRLAGYLSSGGTRIELAPPGLPPLAQHVKAVIQPQQAKGKGRAGERGDLEAELTAERARKLRIESDVREGQLAVAADVRIELFRAARAARDHFLRLPRELANEAITLGLPPEQHPALERAWGEALHSALEHYSSNPLPEP